MAPGTRDEVAAEEPAESARPPRSGRRPLQAIALGLLIVALVLTVRGYDVYADPLGWLLVLYGTRLLPAHLDFRGPLLALAAVAGAIAVPLWVPAIAERVADTEDALAWTLDLPRFGYCALLLLALARAAEAAGDRAATGWLKVVLVATLAVIAAPAVVIGGGLDALDDATGALIALTQIVLVVVLLIYAGRPWAREDPDTAP